MTRCVDAGRRRQLVERPGVGQADQLGAGSLAHAPSASPATRCFEPALTHQRRPFVPSTSW